MSHLAHSVFYLIVTTSSVYHLIPLPPPTLLKAARVYFMPSLRARMASVYYGKPTNQSTLLHLHLAQLQDSTAGFETSLGVVAPPAYPIRGYVYTNAGWRLHATPPD